MEVCRIVSILYPNLAGARFSESPEGSWWISECCRRGLLSANDGYIGGHTLDRERLRYGY